MPSDMATVQKMPQASMRVPLLDLSRQYGPLRDDLLQAVERVLDSQQFILGDEVLALESEIAAYVGAAETIGCGSGTDALWLSLAACDIRAGDEVLTTPFSFFATASAIVRVGARPVFVDIDPVTFNLDMRAVDSHLRKGRSVRLKAILPVHLYGLCCDMDALANVSAEFKLPVIEDAAQAFGATWRGRRAGSFGTASAFSFYPTKNLSAAGEAGCVTTSSPALAEELRALRNHGMRQRYRHESLGWNCRMDGIQGAMLRVKLKHVEHWNAGRRQRAAFYDQRFAAAGLSGNRGSEASPLVIPTAPSEAAHVYHQYVVRATRRDELREYLTSRGIGTEIYYPSPLPTQRPLQYLGYADNSFPETARATAEVLALPMFPELKDEEQQYVVNCIAEFYS
jgi:dTDP-4-amino-4,6-dideoxygalactose transaminase